MCQEAVTSWYKHLRHTHDFVQLRTMRTTRWKVPLLSDVFVTREQKTMGELSVVPALFLSGTSLGPGSRTFQNLPETEVNGGNLMGVAAVYAEGSSALGLVFLRRVAPAPVERCSLLLSCGFLSLCWTSPTCRIM